MGSRMEWPSYLQVELIEAFKKREMLWNSKTPGYRDRAKKYKAWRELANELGQAEEDCRRKMDSLLASFRRERFKIAKSATIGEAELYKPKWMFYNHMLFTKGLEAEADFSSFETNTVTLDDDDQDDSTASTSQQSPQMRCNVAPVRRKLADSPTPPPVAPAPAPPSGRYRRARLEDPNRVNYISTELPSPPPPPLQLQPMPELRPDDSYDIFGKYVASELRGLDEKSLAAVKHQISTAIFEAKINMHNAAAATIVLGDDQCML